MIKIFYKLIIELTNGRFTSKMLKRFATSRISHFIIPSFARVYKINLSEMEKNLSDYPTLHDLFVRKLKTGARAHEPAPSSIVSPVDAVIEDVGEIKETSEITVKGKIYSIRDMLGNEQVLSKYLHGIYMILYLSPSHYHRIHSPVSGEIINQWTLGKKSYPVNKWGLKYGNRTLSNNYRRITEIKHDYGHIAVVKVGAMFVNSIEMVHEGTSIEKGAELAYFTFGSTVVLLFEKDTFQVLPGLDVPTEVAVGQKLGDIFIK